MMTLDLVMKEKKEKVSFRQAQQDRNLKNQYQDPRKQKVSQQNLAHKSLQSFLALAH